MSIYWICDGTDERFNDYDEAWNDYSERYADDYLSEHFRNYVSYDSLLRWAMRQDAFWSDAKMQDSFDRANQDCFEYFYIEHEVEDEEDDD